MRQGKCDKCGKHRWVNVCTYKAAVCGEFCADCFDTVEHDRPASNHTVGGSSGRLHNDPGFDNVIRAYEEDR